MNNQILSLNELIDYKNGQIRSRVLNNAFGVDLSLVIYALDEEESISAEKTTLTKFIQIIDGSLEVTINGAVNTLSIGEMIAVSPNTIHEIYARQRCKFLQFETN